MRLMRAMGHAAPGSLQGGTLRLTRPMGRLRPHHDPCPLVRPWVIFRPKRLSPGSEALDMKPVKHTGTRPGRQA